MNCVVYDERRISDYLKKQALLIINLGCHRRWNERMEIVCVNKKVLKRWPIIFNQLCFVYGRPA